MSFGVYKKQRQIHNHIKYNKYEKYGYDFNKKHAIESNILELTGDSHTNNRQVIEINMGLH